MGGMVENGILDNKRLDLYFPVFHYSSFLLFQIKYDTYVNTLFAKSNQS